LLDVLKLSIANCHQVLQSQAVTGCRFTYLSDCSDAARSLPLVLEKFCTQHLATTCSVSVDVLKSRH